MPNGTTGPLPGVGRTRDDAINPHTGPSGDPAGAKEKSMSNQPTSPPLYDNGEIMKVRLGEADPRYSAADMPAVNRTSAFLKARGAILADAFDGEGLELIQGGIGDCDAGYTGIEWLEAINALTHGDAKLNAGVIPTEWLEAAIHISYGDVRGIGGLITGAKPWLDSLLGVEVRDYVTVTHGGRAAVFMAIRAQVDFMHKVMKEKGLTGLPKIVVPVPTWGTYPDIIAEAMGDYSCFVPIPCEDGLLSAELLDQACSQNPSIRMLIFCNPVNPSGRVYGSDRMARIGRVMHKHQLCGHLDDMYAMFAWEHPHRSMLRAAAALAHAGEEDVGEWLAGHITTLTGVMKAGGSGSRVNVVIIPNNVLRSRYISVQGNLYGPPPQFSQLLQLAFIRNGGPERVWREMLERRNHLQNGLERIREAVSDHKIVVEWSEMEGGFYTLIRFRGVQGKSWTSRSGTGRTINTGEALTEYLLEQAAFIAAPDVATCAMDPEAMRIAYGMMSQQAIDLMVVQLPPALIKLVNGGKQATIRVVPSAG